MAETQITDQTILVALLAEEDRTSLATILARSNWKVRFVRTFRDTQKALRALPGVVISEREFSDGRCWQDLLWEMQKMDFPPALIVADRLADERLWVEVLNLGAHDLLAKPFDVQEVLYAVSTAFQRTENARLVAGRRKPAKPTGKYRATRTRVRTAGTA
jgi:DNA-binding response OmpR family regulator